MDKRLAERIKELRNAYGFTQEEIAEKIGISRQKYIRIENGHCDVTLDLLTRISRIFGIEISDITKVIESEAKIAYRNYGAMTNSSIHEMIDLFYANKRMFDRLHYEERIVNGIEY